MKRVVSTLDKVEKDLGGLESGSKRYSDSGVDRLRASIEKARERLDGLPPAEEGASEQRTRIEDFASRVETLVQANGSLGARSGLDTKLANKVNALDTKLGNLSGELAKFEEGRSELNERTEGRLQSKLEDLERDLGALPGENAVVRQLLEHAAELRARLGALSAGRSEIEGAAAELQARVQALLEGPTFEADQERAEGFLESFKAGNHFSCLNRRRLDLPEASLAAARHWRTIRAEYAQLRARYEEVVEAKARTPLVFTFREADRWLVRYAEIVEEFLGGASQEVAAAAAECRELAATAVAERRHHLFTGFGSDLLVRAAFVRNTAQLHDLAAPEAPPLLPAAETLELELARQEDQLADVIVAENRAADDAYTNADQDELTAFVQRQWAEHFPREEILSVRFPSPTFTRNVAWRLERDRAIKEDHSTLWVQVVVRGEGDEAFLYRVLLKREHLQDDRLFLRWSRPDPVPPKARMLVANLG